MKIERLIFVPKGNFSALGEKKKKVSLEIKVLLTDTHYMGQNV